MKTFTDILRALPVEKHLSYVMQATDRDVERALAAQRRSYADYLALLSPAAEKYLEDIAEAAHEITLRRFGKTIKMFAPVYLSNECFSNCVYCGFRHDNKTPRITLTPDEAVREAEFLANKGFRHLLLLTGESPRRCSVEYIADIARRIHSLAPSVCVEIYSLEEDGYRALVDAGVEGMTMFQETYNEALYPSLHPAGIKRNFAFRLESPERAARAGMRVVSLGALLGLDDWRREALIMGAQLEHLYKYYWQTSFSLSFPRMVESEAGFAARYPVSDRNLVQFMTAVRLFMPDTGFNISTRETANMRMNLLPLGVTTMSAGSSTRPGGYSVYPDSAEQFSIVDDRSCEAVSAAIAEAGYEPVWKDWDPILTGNG